MWFGLWKNHQSSSTFHALLRALVLYRGKRRVIFFAPMPIELITHSVFGAKFLDDIWGINLRHPFVRKLALKFKQLRLVPSR